MDLPSLRELFDKYECDKGTEKHHYYKEYEQYFESVRLEPLKFLEIGTYKGASTRAFHAYFPNATIYTIDIFSRRIAIPASASILIARRVEWLKADSTSPNVGIAIKDLWGEDIKFDFIIDDGAHWPEAIHKTFNNMFPFLKEGGKYFIEDMWPLSIMDEKELAHDFIKGQPNLYSMPDHEKLMETLSIYNTTHYDRRKETRCTDTYMVVVDKMGL